MVKRLLIDATHNEEARVAVVDHNILHEFDSETANKRLIKSNIYLAKVVRVEPSLQAAFVDYGGSRHGFLPFSEIHPDYYRIPVSDRKAIEDGSALITTTSLSLQNDIANDEQSLINDDEISHQSSEESTVREFDHESDPAEEGAHLEDHDESHDELEPPLKRYKYRYKIQEVIKRRQIMLVQINKEERGNKGASLTTYLSLPGRYCVLMPNAGHRAGGISRKISDVDDRKRLRELMKELDIPEGMGLIVRTAGRERNKLEIKRDYEYLLRLWEEIREKTLVSTTPSLIYAESDLIKRAIRDVYDRDIEEVLIEGEEAYKHAKNFMRKLIPSHAKKVKAYKDPLLPLFQKFHVEDQIEKMHEPVVHLPSGGSIVINPTEALVAIDINSGKSTRERHIDETALKTNLEAVQEIARQIRLRDIGGLIVIDFIDMNDPSHVAQVERKMKEIVKSDRARIQIGKISQFGLLELSRQRLKPSLLEAHTLPCPHCKGIGIVRSVESLALQVLREIEKKSIPGAAKDIMALVPSGVDLYLLNQKRNSIVNLESRFGIQIQILRDGSFVSPDFKVEVVSEKQSIMPFKTQEAQPVSLMKPSSHKTHKQESNYEEVSKENNHKEEKQSEKLEVVPENKRDEVKKENGYKRRNKRFLNIKRRKGPYKEKEPQETSAAFTHQEASQQEKPSVSEKVISEQGTPLPKEEITSNKLKNEALSENQPSHEIKEETASKQEKPSTENVNRRRYPYQRRKMEIPTTKIKPPAQKADSLFPAIHPDVELFSKNILEGTSSLKVENLAPTKDPEKGKKRRNWLKRLLES